MARRWRRRRSGAGARRRRLQLVLPARLGVRQQRQAGHRPARSRRRPAPSRRANCRRKPISPMPAPPPAKCSAAAARTPASRGKIRSTGARGTVTPIAAAYTPGRPHLPRFPGELCAQGSSQAWLQGEACQAAQGRLGSAHAASPGSGPERDVARVPARTRCIRGTPEPHIERERVAGRIAPAAQGIFTESWTDARPLRDSGGFEGCERGARSRAPIGSSPRSCIPTPTSTIPRRPRASPSSMPPMRSSATTTSARRSTAARSTPRASRASRASRSARSRAAASVGRGAISRASASVPDGFQRAAAARRRLAAAASRTCCADMFGGAARAAARRARSSSRRISARPPAGQDLHARASPSRWPTPPRAPRRRVHLPTGKDVEVKIPAGIDRRPADPAQGPGLAERGRQGRRCADHRQRRAASGVQAATAPTCGSICRSRSTKRCSAARCACRRSTARSNWRSRPAPTPAAPSGSRARACKAKGGAGDLLATVRIVLPERADDELEELMRKLARQEALRSAQGYGVSPLISRVRAYRCHWRGSASLCCTASGATKLTTSWRRTCRPVPRPTW